MNSLLGGVVPVIVLINAPIRVTTDDDTKWFPVALVWL